MKLSEQFALSVLRLARNDEGWINDDDWEPFFLNLQRSPDTKHISEDTFGFLGGMFKRKAYTITFTDNSIARMWQWTQMIGAIDAPCVWIRYRIVVEVVEQLGETEC